AARKNTRNFAPVTWGDNQPKSSIDGQLESVIPEYEYPSRRVSETEKFTKIHQLYKKYGAGPAERLSGVDLLKRHGTTILGSAFPSTSHIATLSFLQRLKLISDQVQARTWWNAYIEKVEQIAEPRVIKVAKATATEDRQVVDLELIPNNYEAHP